MLIAANWKMHKTGRETVRFCRELRDRLAKLDAGVEVVVCPAYTSLDEAVEALFGTQIGVFAQNVHWEDHGAYTGEISAGMLVEIGVTGTLVSHSERRQLFGETDETAAKRVEAALKARLRTIACVGETDAEREAGEAEAVLERQVKAIRAVVPKGGTDLLTIAYEPVWAIGTGKTATPEQAEEAHAFIRKLLDVPVLYGGSVKPGNAAELFERAHVEGALVGGASLETDSFGAICEAAAAVPS